jgi:hypothetical protein
MDQTTIKKTLKDFFVKQIFKKTLRKFVVFIIYNVYLGYAIYCQAIQPTCTGNGNNSLTVGNFFLGSYSKHLKTIPF